ncbi:50S ribosomal protein L21 [Candidatus Microgenomates bacterium]|nr:MAG: 50S ribosomal protein L21 [Candidatus Microgenomates bacterium]
MDYCVIAINNNQYKVAAGDEILVDLLGEKKPSVEVLLQVDGEKVIVGTPTVKGAVVKMKILGEEKGDKVRVFKYKAKSRYRKTIGSRKTFTKVKIESLS